MSLYLRSEINPFKFEDFTDVNLDSVQSEDKKPTSVAADALSDTTAEAGDSVKASKPEADDSVSVPGDRGQPGTPQLQTESCTESSSPPKTPSSVSLAESVQSASHSESHSHDSQHK